MPTQSKANLSKGEIKQILDILNNYDDLITEAFIFGSRVKGNNQKHSDIDILINSENLGLTRELKNDFIDSDIIYHVDVINIQELEPSVLTKIQKNIFQIK